MNLILLIVTVLICKLSVHMTILEGIGVYFLIMFVMSILGIFEEEEDD